MNLNTIQKQRLIKSFPELQGFFEQQQTRKLLEDVKAQSDDQFKAFLNLLVSKIQSLKGDKGDTGYTPVKGKDYFTTSEINALANYVKSVTKSEVTPIKGKDYFDGKDYILTKQDKKDIADYINVPVVEKVIEKIEVIKEVMPKLDVSMVKGAVSEKDFLAGTARVDGRLKFIDQRWHGGGLSQVYHDTTLTGTGTSSNPLSAVGSTGTWYQDEIVATGQTGTAFSLLHTPTSVVFLYLNGQHLAKGASYDYTIAGKNITLAVALLSSDLLVATYS